jgi:hypothetical protein
MRGANHALGNILGLWGVRPDFNEQPDYSEAAKCRSNFKMFESTARNNGFGSFSGVDRSPYDNDAGILIAKDDRDRITAGQQYGPDAPEVAIEGVDPDLLNAGVQVLSANRLVGGRVDLVRATTLIKKDRRNVQTEQQEDPVPFSALDTAYGSQLVYVPPQFTPRGTPDNYSHGHGFVGIVLPRASRWYWRGLA